MINSNIKSKELGAPYLTPRPFFQLSRANDQKDPPLFFVFFLNELISVS